MRLCQAVDGAVQRAMTVGDTCDPQAKKKIGQKQPTTAGLKRAINAGSTFCRARAKRQCL